MNFVIFLDIIKIHLLESNDHAGSTLSLSYNEVRLILSYASPMYIKPRFTMKNLREVVSGQIL